jgi:hypothetical protein
MPWRHMGEWKFGCTIFVLSTRWRWVISFMPLPFYPRGKSPQSPMDRRLGGGNHDIIRTLHNLWKSNSCISFAAYPGHTHTHFPFEDLSSLYVRISLCDHCYKICLSIDLPSISAGNSSMCHIALQFFIQCCYLILTLIFSHLIQYSGGL